MRHYLTNMQIKLIDLAAAAITSSGRHDIHIDPEPMPIDMGSVYSKEIRGQIRDHLIGGYFSIYVDDSCDCSDFWAEYDRLGKTDYWRTFLTLSE